jgi:hypothetical protein
MASHARSSITFGADAPSDLISTRIRAAPTPEPEEALAGLRETGLWDDVSLRTCPTSTVLSSLPRLCVVGRSPPGQRTSVGLNQMHLA